MRRRLSGLLLLLRALSPILIVLIIGITLVIILGDLRAATDEPIQNIQDEIAEITATIDQVKEEIDTVVADAKSVVDTFNNLNLSDVLPQIPNVLTFNGITLPSLTLRLPDPTKVTISFSSLPDPFSWISYPSDISIGTTNLSVNIPDIPSFNIPIPGVNELNAAFASAFSELLSVFDFLKPVFQSITDLTATLQSVPDGFNSIVTEMGNLGDGIGSLLVKWGGTLGIALAVILVLVIIYFGVPFLDDFTRGWRMIRGLPTD